MANEPRGTKYIRHRIHQTVKRPPNRTSIDNVCNYILETEHDDFFGLHCDYGMNRPSVNHVYYDAYLVIHGSTEAVKMLATAQKAWDDENA